MKWQHKSRNGNIKGGVKTSKGVKKIKDFRVWLTPCLVTSWRDLYVNLLYAGIVSVHHALVLNLFVLFLKEVKVDLMDYEKVEELDGFCSDYRKGWLIYLGEHKV